MDQKINQVPVLTLNVAHPMLLFKAPPKCCNPAPLL